jgi:hypothetical protein
MAMVYRQTGNYPETGFWEISNDGSGRFVGQREVETSDRGCYLVSDLPLELVRKIEFKLLHIMGYLCGNGRPTREARGR